MNNKVVNNRTNAITSVLYPLLFGLVILILWETGGLNYLLNTDTNTLPPPTKISSIVFDNIVKIMVNLKATVIVAIGGLVLGSIIGYLIAVIACIFPKWGAGGIALSAAFNAIPIIALAPVINNLTKKMSDDVDYRSMLAKMLVVMIVCIAGMSINAYRGLIEVKPFSEDLMKTYAARPLTVFIKLRLPNSVPYVFTALRVSVPASIIGALVSEYFAEKVIGVGRQIRENIVQAQFATAWSYIVIACLLGIIMYLILMLSESILLKGRK